MASAFLAQGLPLACSGHLLIDLPIFMGPVLVLVGWLLVMARRGRRQETPSIGAPVSRNLHQASLHEGRLSL